MPASQLVRDMEYAVTAQVDADMAVVEAIDADIGAVELGMEESDILTAIEAYLLWCDKPEEWEGYIQQVIMEVTPPGAVPDAYTRYVAECIALREMVAMERRIQQRGGFWSVMRQIQQRDLDASVENAEAALAIDQLPKWDLLPPYPAVDALDLLAEQVESVTPPEPEPVYDLTGDPWADALGLLAAYGGGV